MLNIELNKVNELFAISKYSHPLYIKGQPPLVFLQTSNIGFYFAR